MMVEVSKIKVGDRIRKDFGNIEELASDIAKNGLINPPAVTPELVLIAGERRLRAIQHLGWPQIEVNVMTVRDALHHVELEVSENENRKDFTFSEKMQWAKLLKEEYSAKAKAAQEATRFGSLVCEQLRTPVGRVSDSVAETIGLGSGRNFDKAEYVIGNATPEMIQQLDDGALSINAAYNALKQKLAAKESALKKQSDDFDQERATFTRKLEAQVQKVDKLESEKTVLKRLGDFDMNIEVERALDRERAALERAKIAEAQYDDEKRRAARIENEIKALRKNDGFHQAVEEERDNLREQLESLQNQLASVAKQTSDVKKSDANAILDAIRSNVDLLCSIELDLNYAELVELNNNIAKAVQPLEKLRREIIKLAEKASPAA